MSFRSDHGCAEKEASNELRQADAKKLKLAELREELESRGLNTSGKKSELVVRLEKALASGSKGLV